MRARVVAVRAAAVALAVAAAAWAAPRYGLVYVGGDSMRPALWRGDLVVVRRDMADQVTCGDIALVDKRGWPSGVLHRVETVYADGSLLLRGDANPVPDLELVPRTRIRGAVGLVVPFGRAFAAVERLVRRWYNPPSHVAYRGFDGEDAHARMPLLARERAHRRWKGRSRGERARFAPPAAHLKGTWPIRACACVGVPDPPLAGRPG